MQTTADDGVKLCVKCVYILHAIYIIYAFSTFCYDLTLCIHFARTNRAVTVYLKLRSADQDDLNYIERIFPRHVCSNVPKNLLEN